MERKNKEWKETRKRRKQIEHNKEIQIYTDSQYVKLGITEWINTWVKNNWQTSKKEDVKNKDLWIELYDLNNSFNIKWNWIKAHSGNALNEEVDLLAKKAALLDQFQKVFCC